MTGSGTTLAASRPSAAAGAGVAVIGAGPAGLMAAEVLASAGHRVDVFDAMPSVGRKFLLAGVGGLNLTHGEPFDAFVSRYGSRAPVLAPLLREFGADALRGWAAGLGITTFVGSSGRVFPTDMKAAPLLRAWLHRLRGQGVRLHMRHRWQGWGDDGALRFDTPQGALSVAPQATVLALGGASWPRLGSISFDGWRQVGECVVTAGGLEGSLVYAASAALRERIVRDGAATFELDLLPQRPLDWVARELAHPRGPRTLSTHLKTRLHLSGVKAGLLWELVPKEVQAQPERFAALIKALPICVTAPRPIAEAISSAGGVRFEALDEGLMLRALPGVFCAGEMLDWEASTGGYLLTACFATGRAAGRGAARWLAGGPGRNGGRDGAGPWHTPRPS